MAAFTNKDGEELVSGRWYNFGGNVSIGFTGKVRKSFRMRLDTTGETARVSRWTPAAYDAVSNGLFLGRTPWGYAIHCFGGKNVQEAGS